MSTRRSKCNTNCCVYGCSSKKGRDTHLHFHVFPRKNQMVNVANIFGTKNKICRQNAWKIALSIGKPITASMKVCSRHFIQSDYLSAGVTTKKPKLKNTAIPSQNLPKRGISDNNVTNTNKDRSERAARRNARRENLLVEGVANESHHNVNSLDISEIENRICRLEDLTDDDRVIVTALLDLQETTVNPLDHMTRTKTTRDQSVQVTSGDIYIRFIDSIQMDLQLNSLTGIPSFNLLDGLVKLLERFYPDKKHQKLSIKEKVVLILMKMKMAVKFNVLSFLFHISNATCKRIFEQYLPCLSNVLKCCIVWPTAEQTKSILPKCFEGFPTVTVILDCTEIPVQKTKCLCCRVRTYSHYKGGQTVEYMTVVTPGGLICAISKGYGGRCSDKAIFEQSGVINELTPHRDSVMVDKGFLIDDICGSRYIKVIRPHFLRQKEQFTEEEARQNVFIAKARVHIERLNQRIKIFQIFTNTLPWCLINHVDDLFTIACALVNLQNPILGDDKF